MARRRRTARACGAVLDPHVLVGDGDGDAHDEEEEGEDAVGIRD